MFRCTIDPNKTNRVASYAINDFLTPHPFGASHLDCSRMSGVPSPSETLYMAECADRFDGSDLDELALLRHLDLALDHRRDLQHVIGGEVALLGVRQRQSLVS